MIPELLRSRRFMPLFVTQFLGAFNDNYFKNSLFFIIAYKMISTPEYTANMTNVIGGLFVLPFFIFSATAGQLADKYDRARITRILKAVEIVLMLVAGVAIYIQSIPLALCILFLMCTQSTFFGPIKYALLPQHLKEEELIAGNAYIEGGTYLAILTGTILGGIMIMWPHGEFYVWGGLLTVSIGGFIASMGIPTAKAPMPELKVNYNMISETWVLLQELRRQTVVWRCVLGISWFWLVGSLLLLQLTPFCKDILGTEEGVFTLFLTIFSLGIGLGSLWCKRLLNGLIETTYVPLGALGMTIFIADLYFVSRGVHRGPTLIPMMEFLHHFYAWRLCVDMLMIAVCGGLFIVPLYAMMQNRAKPESMARVVAANNIVNAIFMVAAALAALVALRFKFTIPEIILGTAIVNFIVGIYICRLLPDALLRSIVRGILTLLFRIEVKNMENYTKAGDRVLIIANHTSLIDGLLVAAFMPEKVTFAINTQMAKKWWVKPVLALVNAFPLDPTNPMGIRSLIEEIRKDRKCMIFPEGRITVTGALMKVYEGSGMIAEKSGAMVLPIRISGAQYSKLSYMKNKLRTCWFPKITITVLEPKPFKIAPELKGRERRHKISEHIYDMMLEMVYQTTNINEHLFTALLNAATVHGYGHRIAEDISRKVLTYRQLIMKSYLLGNMMRKYCPEEQYIGLMLPTSLANIVSFWGLQAYDRIPCMINFSSGSTPVLASCKAVGIKTIFSSRKFIQMAKLEALEKTLLEAGYRVICLEDLKQQSSKFTLLGGLLHWVFHSKPRATADQPAVVLFTSGSEGLPKGVLLSHRNLMANKAQVLSVIALNNQDRIFNCLPMFHSFGLSAGMILPVLAGIRTFFYPSPLHYRIIPELSYDTMTTVIFGTDTFLAAYGRVAHPYDFFSIRFALVGAEKLKDSTAELWANKFGVRIFEGYGATETAPVATLNTPMYCKRGTVGRLLPGIEYRLEPIPGIENGGKLLLKGDNIMVGYMKYDNPGVLQPPTDGWYDTGDIVEIDNADFVSIKGRVKRFAKIAGEMVSLTAVETAIEKLWPKNTSGIVAMPDPRKGEQLVLITNNQQADVATMIKYFKENGMSELWAPKKVIYCKHPPLLGSGKFDYVSAKKLAEENQAG